ncbi:M48 family metalloprotease [Ekhidna sp.]|uniref:M48 family metalloprotease n=1 Tax=Ekhidna sp. TaxID=2608089 RepID=UPI003B500E19
MKVGHLIISTVFIILTISSCQKTDELIDFTESDEILLGDKIAQFIENDPGYSIIPEEGNTIPYGYVNSRLQEVISTSAISKGEDFQWTIRIFESDTRHAFAHPGGYLYISTGMIFYLDNEDQFTGLIAHFVAHINLSHITERLFFKYGVNGLKSIAESGDEESIRQIVEDLDLNNNYIILSRAHELQSDTLAITILSETTQSCQSNGLFFSRVLNVQPSQQAALINAHRLTQERVDDIENITSTNGCDAIVDDESSLRYRSFRNSIP